jgi:3-isopropylmalate dehydratase
MAAAAALAGKLADVRKIEGYENALPDAKSAPNTVEAAHSEDPESDVDLDKLMDLPQDDAEATHSSAKSGATGAAGMPPFTQLKGIAAPMDRANVDTDAIIPKQFLKTIKRAGLSTGLFYAWRFNPDGSPNPDFVLNKEPYTKSKILVVGGPNFGCGSSREHAPWALLDFGIKCVIASSFGDIFFNNTFKNGMLPLQITDQAVLATLLREAEAGRELEVDLEKNVINDADGKKLAEFEVEEFRRHCLINGLDDIGLTMQDDDKITRFEKRRSAETPWLDGSGYLSKHRPGPVQVAAAPVPKTNRGEPKTEPLEW